MARMHVQSEVWRCMGCVARPSGDRTSLRARGVVLSLGAASVGSFRSVSACGVARVWGWGLGEGWELGSRNGHALCGAMRCVGGGATRPPVEMREMLWR
eukprot:1283107-Prymnesium_polylepis.1